MTTPIVTGRVFPGSKHSFYFDVEIYETLEEMQEAATAADRLCGVESNFEDSGAVTLGFRRGFIHDDGSRSWYKILGCIYLWLGELKQEVISHEATHAAIRWAESTNLPFKLMPTAKDVPAEEPTCSDEEEIFCYAVGQISSQLANIIWENGLYERWQESIESEGSTEGESDPSEGSGHERTSHSIY